MATLVENVMGLFAPIAGPLASQMGESTDTVQRGLRGEPPQCSLDWHRVPTNPAF